MLFKLEDPARRGENLIQRGGMLEKDLQKLQFELHAFPIPIDRHTEPGSKTKVTNTITESCLNAQKSVSSSIPVYFHLQGCWHLTNSKLQFTSHNSAQNCLSLRQGALCVYLFFFNVISIVVILHNPHLLHHLCCTKLSITTSRNSMCLSILLPCHQHHRHPA